MSASNKDRLYALARRLSVGRVLRYADLWTRYAWRRAQSTFGGKAPAEGKDAGTLAAAVAAAEAEDAKRLAVSSWFPLDLANARLHAAILAGVAAPRPDLGLSPAIGACLARLKAGQDLAARVEAEVANGETPETVNTALYILLLRRLPASSEQPMIATRNPLHALIAIQSGDEFTRHGRRTRAG